MVALLDRVKAQHNDTDPYSMIIFSNHPHHYALEQPTQSNIFSQSCPNRRPFILWRSGVSTRGRTLWQRSERFQHGGGRANIHSSSEPLAKNAI